MRVSWLVGPAEQCVDDGAHPLPHSRVCLLRSGERCRVDLDLHRRTLSHACSVIGGEREGAVVLVQAITLSRDCQEYAFDKNNPML